MEQAKVIKDAKVIEVVQVVYLAGEENSSTNPLRLITEYRSKDGAFLAEFDSHQYQKGSEKYGHQRRIRPFEKSQFNSVLLRGSPQPSSNMLKK